MRELGRVLVKFTYKNKDEQVVSQKLEVFEDTQCNMVKEFREKTNDYESIIIEIEKQYLNAPPL